VAFVLYVLTVGAALLLATRTLTAPSRKAAALLIALPLLFTGPALLRNRVYGGYDILFMCAPFSDYGAEYGFKESHNWSLVDQVLQFAPWQHEVRRAFADGEWPLWNPTMDSGEVLAGNMQSAPLNPLNLIGMLLPLDLATGFDASMVFFLAALFTFAYARELGCSERAALVGAAAFTLSSAMAFHVGWPHARSWTTLPFVLLAVRRVVRERDFKSCAILTAALTLLIVFGHPETMLHVVTIGVIYGLYEMFEAGWRGMPIAIASGITAVLLTAITLLPFAAILGETWEFRARTYIAKTTVEPIVAHNVVKSVGATFIPYFGGASWWTPAEFDFGTARVGSIVLALAAVAAVRFWRRRDVRFLIGLLIPSLLACWKLPPMTTLFRALPLFNVSLNERFGFAAALALSLLAAIAFDALTGRRIVLVVGIALAIATAATWSTRMHYRIDHELIYIGAAAELAGIALLLLALSKPRHAFAILIVALIAQRIVEDGNIYPALPRKQFYPRVPLVAAIPPDPLYRVVATSNLFAPNVSAMYGLDDVRGYSATTLYAYWQTTPLWSPDAHRNYHDVNDLSRPFLSFLGVKWALTPASLAPPDGWRVVRDDRSTRLMENTRAIPRVFVPRHVRFVDNHQVALDEMALATDFGEQAWLYSREVPPHVAPNGETALNVKRVGTRYEIDADARLGTHVVVTESAWPGWRAYVDGRRVKIERANRAFLSVFVPQGKHHVRVVYRPDEFVIGRAISIATLMALIVIALVRATRSHRAA